MKIQEGNLVPLGYGAYVRSDEVVALQPVAEGRGPGRRTLVWVRGLPEALVASRGDESLARDLLDSDDDAARALSIQAVLEQLTDALDSVPPVLLRVLEEETGHDFAALTSAGRRVLA